MACETRLRPQQTISQRAAEIRSAVQRLVAALVAGRVQLKVGANGAPVFTGWQEESRDGISDLCAYRQIMRTGDATSRMLIQRAEQMSGRPVNKAAVAAGLHSHDGGTTWHSHKH